MRMMGSRRIQFKAHTHHGGQVGLGTEDENRPHKLSKEQTAERGPNLGHEVQNLVVVQYQLVHFSLELHLRVSALIHPLQIVLEVLAQGDSVQTKTHENAIDTDHAVGTDADAKGRKEVGDLKERALVYVTEETKKAVG